MNTEHHLTTLIQLVFQVYSLGAKFLAQLSRRLATNKKLEEKKTSRLINNFFFAIFDKLNLVNRVNNASELRTKLETFVVSSLSRHEK